MSSTANSKPKDAALKIIQLIANASLCPAVTKMVHHNYKINEKESQKNISFAYILFACYKHKIKKKILPQEKLLKNLKLTVAEVLNTDLPYLISEVLDLQKYHLCKN